MSRVFVAGATGVVGRRVVTELVAAGHDVTAVVRTNDKADAIRRRGAVPVEVDLFDLDAVAVAVEGHDVVVNVATSIPSGVRAALPSAWRPNDLLRTLAAQNLAQVVPASGRYIGESITFPYLDGGDRWLDEETERSFFALDQTVYDAEAAAASVTERGAVGVTLRFAMFWASDSAHNEMIVKAAQRGWWLLPGRDESYVSWIHIDDAARAVLAALDAPAGIYNVAEADPRPRGEHADALARACGRRRLRRVPGVLERIGGSATESIARSQRITSAKLTEATGWTPIGSVIDHWGDR